MKCSKCGGSRFYPACLISPDNLWEGDACGKCGLIPKEGRDTHDNRKLNERCRSKVTVQTVGGGVLLHVDDKAVKLSLPEAKLFDRAVRWAYHCARRGKENDERRRLNIDRWVLLGETAQFRGLHDRTTWTISFRRTTPRRNWRCTQCTGALLAGVAHWIGVKPEMSARRLRWEDVYRGPAMPRFCDRCVHVAKTDPDHVVEPGRPLRLVEAAK